MKKSMKRLAALALLAVGLGSSGCVTYATRDMIQTECQVPTGKPYESVTSTRGQVLEVVTFPVTAAVDVALAPVYVLAAPVVLVELTHIR